MTRYLMLCGMLVIGEMVADKVVDWQFATRQETGYTQSQRAAMHDLVQRVDKGVAFDTKARPVALYRTQADRDKAIASIYMAGRE